jgi:hypothetical protein
MTTFLFSLCQFEVSWRGAPSPTRGRVCNLLEQLLLGLARSFPLGFKSRRTHTIFHCLILDSTNLHDQVPIFISPRKRMAQLYPWGTGFPLLRLLRQAGLWFKRFFFSKLYQDRRSVGQSVLVSGTHLGPATNFSFSLKLYLDSCVFVIMGRLLWREDGSVIYNCYWASPAKSFSSPCSERLMTKLYFLKFEIPLLWSARFPYLLPGEHGSPRISPSIRFVSFIQIFLYFMSIKIGAFNMLSGQVLCSFLLY